MTSSLIKSLPIILIVLLGLVFRFNQLGQNPPGLFMDEASNGYNAYSILKTARDEYGNYLPLTFRAFGDYNPALSVYLLVPAIAIFGLNEFAVRFPSALLGTLTIILSYFLIKQLFGNKVERLALLTAFFLALSPWHIQFSRYDHEANFMVFFITLGAVFFFKGLKKHQYLTLSMLAFGLALNTYHGAKIWTPLFLINLIFWFHSELFSLRKKLTLPLLVFAIFTLPYLLNINNSLTRGKYVGIFNNPDPLQTVIAGYLSHFSPNFLFTRGDTIPRHSVQNIGQLYVFEFPLILIGILAALSKKGKPLIFLLSWLIIAPIPASLATPTPHALRSITFLPVWSFFTAYGVISIASTKIKTAYKFIIFLILTVIGAYNITTYLHLYYIHYPKEKARDWQNGYGEMVRFVDTIKNDYSQIAISNYYGQPYIFVLFYSKYDPKMYQTQSQNKNAFDKFEFFGASWEKTKTGKALIVTPSWQDHPPTVLKNIYATNGDLTFTISEAE